MQKNKQVLSVLTKRVSDGLTSWKPPDNSGRINARWTNEELLIAVQGVRKYGKDFKAIADVIGTKNETHVRMFFISYRKRYNLDAVLKEFEEENGPIPEEEKVISIPSAAKKVRTVSFSRIALFLFSSFF